MNRLETEALLAFVSTLDQRIISEDVIESWHRILGGVAPVVARQAVEEHFANKPDTYLKVGHVLQGAKKISEKKVELSSSEQRALEEANWKGSAQPVCKEHSELITRCDPCCDVLAWQVEHMGSESKHAWAVAHLYKPESEWAA
jgi:hypothetical protein